MKEEWAALLDQKRVDRQVRAATSPLLRGMLTNLTFRWQEVIATALAKRIKQKEPD